MKWPPHTFYLSILLVLVAGCSTAIHKSFSVDEKPPKSLSLDARQRTILVTDRGGENGNRHIVCAEPSPDVASALAATFGTTLSTGKGSMGLSASQAESLAQLGRRTQTIQLLRDVLYRACESLMNGAITDVDYRRIIVAMDEFMITLLAIEGLLQQAPLQPIALNTSARSNVPQNASGASPSPAPATGDGAPSTSATGTAAPAANIGPQSLSEHTAKQVAAILHSYLCFQLNLKKTFLVHDAWEKQKNVAELVSLWKSAGIECALAAERFR